RKLCIEWLTAECYRIESINIVAARLKLVRLEEELRDVYPIALGRITRAVINRIHPAIETKIIRFAAKKVYVLLAHEEIRVVYRIWPIHCLVISDRDRRCRNSS